MSRCLQAIGGDIQLGLRHRLGRKHIQTNSLVENSSLDWISFRTRRGSFLHRMTAQLLSGTLRRRVKYEDSSMKIGCTQRNTATATSHHVRVWDNEDGRLLYKIQLSWSSGVGLFWVYNLLFVTSKYKVWKIKRTIISEWSIPETNETSCTVPQGHGEFFVSTTGRTVRFWDILTQIQLLPIQRSQDIKSVTHSPDDQFIAIAGKDGKITIKRLSHISVSTVSSCISTFLLKLSPLGHFSIHCTRFVEARQTHGCGRIVARCNPHV